MRWCSRARRCTRACWSGSVRWACCACATAAQDDKIIGVPIDALDPAYADVRDINDLPAAERARIEAFFRVYKDLPQGRGAVVLDGFGDAAEAKVLVREALRRFPGAAR